jgi:anti-sigma B factor antagonist
MPADSESVLQIFEADVTRDGEVVTIALRGEFDLAVVDTVRAKFEEARGDGSSLVVIDLRALTFIDSTGIAFLLSAVKGGEGPRLSFIPSEAPAVQRVFAVTGVAALFGGAPENESPPSGA